MPISPAFIKERARSLGFQAAGITDAAPFTETQEVMLQRIDQGLFSGLPWFTPERARLACQPRELLPNARSIIALAASYNADAPEPDATSSLPRGRVARYAWGRDYHAMLRSRLDDLLEAIAAELGYHPGARIFVDSSPLPERAVAQRAGLGWVGKNTNLLVHGLGSWTFLAAVILDIALPEDEPILTHCGSCDLCLQACPTGALLTPYVLDNNRCISYQTIENRGAVPTELRPLMGDWVYGCDICQDVCPVNRKAATTGWDAFTPASQEAAHPDLISLLSMDTPEYQERFRGSAMKRAKQSGLQRNAAVALGNDGNPAAMPALQQAQQHPDALVRSHVAWAMGRIGGKEARRSIEHARQHESDPQTLREIDAALTGA